ncbi:hypothetical protein EDB81DRAFT_886707 [Dactylonectria macrodidyma]|uniref:DUF7905 domain-containing protein n=1 Tax=Dactylonectria macrodidyma TaxID=307937 RepID=A0A9P9EFC4_9HYPO|nr:hypothetical protein EDB81DRAFT_886707 [Dactylonectria macrodidyma]
MDRPSRRGKSQPHRGRGGARGKPFAPRPAGEGREASWSKEKSMGTAKSMKHNNIQKARKVEDNEFLGPPPPMDTNMVQHRLPRGLDEPGALDDIRKAHKVYITNVKPNVLDLRCDSISRMQQAIHALNWAIHDLRLSNDHPPARFLVQEPTNADINGMVRVEIGSRPRFASRSPTLVDNSAAMDKHLVDLAADLPKSADTIMALNKSMKMRVNFGQLLVRARNTRGRDEITHDEFVKLLNMYSIRGGASLETKLPEVAKAEQVIQYLVDPEQGICNDQLEVCQSWEVTLVSQGLEVKADGLGPLGTQIQLSMPRSTRPEAWGRLNWTVVAPDMHYDWNLRVDAWDDEDVPGELRDFFSKVKLTMNSTQVTSAAIRIPHISTHKLGKARDTIGQLKLKSSATIPYKSTPYVIEVSVTKAWQGSCTTDEPETTWGIEVYAAHWDESIMHTSGDDHRKDWGQGLKNMWPGDQPALEARFEEFLDAVLEIQALLQRACPM